MTDNGLSPLANALLSIALEEARQGTLEVGGLTGLFDFHQQTFGSARMEDGEEDGGDTEDADGADGENDTTGGGDDDRDPKRKISALTDEKDRHYKARKAAEEALAETQARLKELEEKDLGEQEKTVRERDELKTVNEQLSQRVSDLALENAFLKDNTFQWHNPARALKLADLSEVKINDDGSVSGLKEALQSLAKSDAYLLKTADDGKGKQDLPPGGDPQNGRKKDKNAPDREKLLSKYPALRR